MALCHELVPGSRPIFVPVRPERDAELQQCFLNVDRYVERHGGDVCHGWAFWELPGILLSAEFHGVWRDSGNQLVDITPKQDPVDQILFLVDPKLRYEGKLRDNVRRALMRSPAVERLIAVQQRKFHVLNAGERGPQHEVALSDEESALLDALEQEEAAAIVEAMGPAGFRKLGRKMGWDGPIQHGSRATKSGPQRSLPLWQRQEAQALLRSTLGQKDQTNLTMVAQEARARSLAHDRAQVPGLRAHGPRDRVARAAVDRQAHQHRRADALAQARGTDESKAQARAAALREARAKADALAAEAGVRITSVLRIEELDGNEHRGFRTDHGVMYSQLASASFEHEELIAATRDVEYAFRLRFGIEPSQR